MTQPSPTLSSSIFHRVSLRWAALGCALWPLDAAAQEVDDVVVEAPAEDARAPSAWRSRVDLARLQQTGGDLAEGLGALPGVTVRRQGGPGARAELTARGGSAQQVLVLLDGVPLNAARGGGVDLALIPPALLSGAAVHRGGGGARFGSGALGGAVSLTPALPERGARWSLQGDAGSFGTWGANAAAAGAAGPLRALVALDGLLSDGDFRFEDDQGSPRTRINADVARASALGVLVFAPAPRWTLRLTGLLSEAERGAPGLAEFQDVLSEARAADGRALTTLRLRGEALVQTPDLFIDFEAFVAWRREEARYENPQRLLRSAAPFESEALDQSGRAGVLVAWGLGRGLFGHVGGEAARDGLEQRARDPLGAWARLRARRDQGALFADAEWALWGERASLLGALRLEAVEGVGVTPSPSLGVRVAPGGGVTVMGNAARAWRAPGFEELYLEQEFLQGDPALRPEDAVSLDLGARWEPRPWLRAEAVAFWLEIRDLILFLPVSPLLYRAQNTGAARARGVELSLEARPHPRVGLSGNWTWTDAALQLPPMDPLPGRPAHEVEASASLHGEGWEVFVRGRGRSTLTLDNFGSLRDPPALFVDAGVSARPWRGVMVSLTARNLLDERGAVDALQTPLPGASVTASLRWSGEREGEE
jgi:vitamin B12 transporter